MDKGLKKYSNGTKALIITLLIVLILILLIIIYIRFILPIMIAKDILSEKKSSFLSQEIKKQLKTVSKTMKHFFDDNNVSPDSAIKVISSIKIAAIQSVIDKLMNDEFTSVSDMIDELLPDKNPLKSDILELKNELANKYTLTDVKNSIAKFSSNGFSKTEIVLFWPSIKKLLIEMIKKENQKNSQ